MILFILAFAVTRKVVPTNPLRMLKLICERTGRTTALSPTYRVSGSTAPPSVDLGMYSAALVKKDETWWKKTSPLKVAKYLNLKASEKGQFGFNTGFWDGDIVSIPTCAKTYLPQDWLQNNRDKIPFSLYPQLAFKIADGKVSESKLVPVIFELSSLKTLRWSKELRVDRYLWGATLAVVTPPVEEQEFFKSIAAALNAQFKETKDGYSITCSPSSYRRNATADYTHLESDPALQFMGATPNRDDCVNSVMALDLFSDKQIDSVIHQGQKISVDVTDPKIQEQLRRAAIDRGIGATTSPYVHGGEFLMTEAEDADFSTSQFFWSFGYFPNYTAYSKTRKMRYVFW